MTALRLLTAALLAAAFLLPASAFAVKPAPPAAGSTDDVEQVEDVQDVPDLQEEVVGEEPADEPEDGAGCPAGDAVADSIDADETPEPEVQDEGPQCFEPAAGVVDILDTVQFLEDVLADNAVDGGSVQVPSAAKITREVRLAPTARARKAAKRKRGRAPVAKLVAKATREVGSAGGTAELRLKLVRGARKTLAKRGATTVSVRTTIKRRGHKPVVYTRSIELV